MSPRTRTVMTISLPPETAREYRKLASIQGETISELFRDMFTFYKQEKFKREFSALQEYGTGVRKEMGITEEDIERLVFEDR